MSGPFALAAAARYPRMKAAAALYGVDMVTDAPDSPHLGIPNVKGELYVGFAEHDPAVAPHVVPALKSALEDASGALGSAERMLTSTEANLVGPGAPGQVELRNAMQELARAARSLRTLADYLEQHPEALIRGKTAQPMPK